MSFILLGFANRKEDRIISRYSKMIIIKLWISKFFQYNILYKIEIKI